jgi:outer membrane protein OmpA-like peptidoglycan-associated protein
MQARRKVWPIAGLGLVLAHVGAPLWALVPEFAAPAKISQTTAQGPGTYALPVGPFAGGEVPTQVVQGDVAATAYQIDSRDLSTLEIFAPLRDQIEAAGYQVQFECADVECGGYDFRFATRVIAEPAMHVDLADYRFMSATRAGPAGVEAISLMVSRSALKGFVQVIEVGAGAADVATPTEPIVAPVVEGITSAPEVALPPLEEKEIGAALESRGSVALEDVAFDPGASVLSDGDFPSLAALADWLKADPSRVVVLVGHTDASGGLAANVALGAKRAAAIRARLVGELGVQPGQVSAEGAGFLAPRASNLTDEGRRLNRRVEVVLVPQPE